MYYLTHTLVHERGIHVATNSRQEKEVVLSLEQLTKKIGNQTLVDHLSFQVRRGEIVGLLGPNGAGKTTTIRMIVGLTKMTSGDALILGKSIKNEFAEAIRHAGAIVENPEFYPYMTGRDNLKQYQRMTPNISNERMEQVIQLVGLTEAMDKKVKAYSLGMRQRLGIAQALLNNPSILILDEPTNGLDPAGIREMRDYLKHIAKQEGIAILVSSHLLSEMELMCSRVVVLQQGKLVTEQNLDPQAISKNSEQLVSLLIRVNKVEQANQVIQGISKAKIQSVHEDYSTIVVSIADEDIPALVVALTEQGVGIYRMSEQKQSLEDEFLKWTGGSQIV